MQGGIPLPDTVRCMDVPAAIRPEEADPHGKFRMSEDGDTPLVAVERAGSSDEEGYDDDTENGRGQATE